MLSALQWNLVAGGLEPAPPQTADEPLKCELQQRPLPGRATACDLLSCAAPNCTQWQPC